MTSTTAAKSAESRYWAAALRIGSYAAVSTPREDASW
jgi:hypothetical protein